MRTIIILSSFAIALPAFAAPQFPYWSQCAKHMKVQSDKANGLVD